MKTNKFNVRFKRVILSALLLVSLGGTLGTVTGTGDLFSVGEVKAEVIGGKYNKDQEDTSQGKLRQSIDDAISDNVYKGSDDRDYRGAELVKNGITNDKAELLRRDQREKLFTDMNNEAERQIEKSKDAIREDPDTDQKNVVDEKTKSNWVQELSASPGMGTELISAVLADFKPNLIAGHRILAPFEGWFGTIAGIFVIVAMLGLALTITIDMAYLFFPAFQQMVTSHSNSRESQGGKGGGGGFFVSKYNNMFVSREAIQALEESEQNEGKAKSPYGIYFWKKGLAMFMFGLLLMYLAQGDLWRFVGMMLDALKGFGL